MKAARHSGRRPLETAVDVLTVLGTWAILLAYFTPDLLLLPTTTTGGDTGSHYAIAHYTLHELLPAGRILGWAPGNLAGYPLYQLYFPLPFAAMAGLSFITGLPVAFKLISAVGAFLLPLCAYGGLRWARLPFPIPAVGAVCTLPFLFNETQAMWGGNLPSLLAGEFCYSISLALMVLWLGAMFGDMDKRRRIVLNGVLLALVGLCHGCTLLFAVCAGGLWLCHRDAAERSVYLFKVYALAFVLMGFWIVPLLANSSLNTMHNMVWHIDKWQKVLPPMVMPLLGIGLLYGLWAWFRPRPDSPALGGSLYFAALIALALTLYLLAFRLNVADIRFFPFAWLAACMWGAVAIGHLAGKLTGRALAPLLLLACAALVVSWQTTYIHSWIDWNYLGFESRPEWRQFQKLNATLRGGVGDPRVVHEHSDLLNKVGTTRAFENLPLFAGRNTMEGLYLQSSLASPFVFYLQSQTSFHPSMPLPGYNYSRFDLSGAAERMALFNVGQYVTVSKEARQAARSNPAFKESFNIGPYSVFEVVGNQGMYAEALKYKPVLVITQRWKELAFEWFRGGDLKVPLVFKAKAEPGDEQRFAAVWRDQLGKVPRMPLPAAGELSQRIEPQQMVFKASNLAPLLIKVSYHPNWKVSGARRVYRASPCFMLVFPDQPEVTLTYGITWPNYLGQGLSVIGLLVLFLCAPGIRRLNCSIRLRAWFQRPLEAVSRLLQQWLAPALAWCGRHPWRVSIASALTAGLLLSGYLLYGGRVDASVAFHQAYKAYQDRDYGRAAVMFRTALKQWPHSPLVDNTALHWGLSLYLQDEYGPALRAFQRLLDEYPESRKAAEALYHMGMCRLSLGHEDEAQEIFSRVMIKYKDDPWANRAEQQLKQMR